MSRVDRERRLVNRLVWGRPTTVRNDRNDHGTHRCYVAGCRCDPCTDAEADYSYARAHPGYKPFLFCRHGDHERCPITVAGLHCPCLCHAKAKVA